MELEVKHSFQEVEKDPSPSSKLLYSIHSCSSYSATYFPENILNDNPKDQTSRWSSDSNTPPQFLTLKLQRAAIIDQITFGKFEKTHVCNLKKFKIYGGLTEDKMSELLESGLKNDNIPEIFSLRLKVHGYSYPCQYLKIVPLQSWGPSFNFSIWHVELTGTDDFRIVQPCVSRFNAFRQEEAIRVCLKHLRDYNYNEAFKCLQRKTKVQLEHPLVSELHETLVRQGDYIAAEGFIEQCAKAHLFRKYISKQDYKANWTMIPSDNTPSAKPSPRGGHQLIVDSSRNSLYLFGGWDGIQDLADFWIYDIPSNKWSTISTNTESEGGPTPRSCHKMCLDPKPGKLFTLGHYSDTLGRQKNDLKSDFYMYNIEANVWTLISGDTALDGGPELIFDHQLCVDADRHTIFVFGGTILAAAPSIPDTGSLFAAMEPEEEEANSNGNEPPRPSARNQLGVSRNIQANVQTNGGGLRLEGSNQVSSANHETLYSGLFSYNILTNTWVQLRCDITFAGQNQPSILSRVGHSMLYHPGSRKLYIFSGQRSKEYLNDFFSYDLDKDDIEILSDGSPDSYHSKNAPLPGFTQRATIDPELNEIFVFSGLSKEKDKKEDSAQNSFWVYDISRSSWTCVYRTDIIEDHNWLRIREPCPRFAHQLVYDQRTKTHFLFGGNPGRNKEGKLRLDDFWKLNLCRPGRDDILRQCKLMLRKLHFEELALKNSLCALTFLQTSLAELINDDDPLQSIELQRLALLLFRNGVSENEYWLVPDEEYGNRDQVFKRSKLFDKLARFFPDDMTQPKLNLIDIVSV